VDSPEGLRGKQCQAPIPKSHPKDARIVFGVRHRPSCGQPAPRRFSELRRGHPPKSSRLLDGGEKLPHTLSSAGTKSKILKTVQFCTQVLFWDWHVGARIFENEAPF
jgi:hypothetical protein